MTQRHSKQNGRRKVELFAFFCVAVLASQRIFGAAPLSKTPMATLEVLDGDQWVPCREELPFFSPMTPFRYRLEGVETPSILLFLDGSGSVYQLAKSSADPVFEITDDTMRNCISDQRDGQLSQGLAIFVWIPMDEIGAIDRIAALAYASHMLNLTIPKSREDLTLDERKAAFKKHAAALYDIESRLFGTHLRGTSSIIFQNFGLSALFQPCPPKLEAAERAFHELVTLADKISVHSSRSEYARCNALWKEIDAFYSTTTFPYSSEDRLAAMLKLCRVLNTFDLEEDAARLYAQAVREARELYKRRRTYSTTFLYGMAMLGSIQYRRNEESRESVCADLRRAIELFDEAREFPGAVGFEESLGVVSRVELAVLLATAPTSSNADDSMAVMDEAWNTCMARWDAPNFRKIASHVAHRATYALIQLGRHSEALLWARRGVSAAEYELKDASSDSNVGFWLGALRTAAMAAEGAGRWDIAEIYYRRMADGAAGRTTLSQWVAQAWIGLAAARYMCGDEDGARDYCEMARQRLDSFRTLPNDVRVRGLYETLDAMENLIAPDAESGRRLVWAGRRLIQSWNGAAIINEVVDGSHFLIDAAIQKAMQGKWRESRMLASEALRVLASCDDESVAPDICRQDLRVIIDMANRMEGGGSRSPVVLKADENGGYEEVLKSALNKPVIRRALRNYLDVADESARSGIALWVYRDEVDRLRTLRLGIPTAVYEQRVNEVRAWEVEAIRYLLATGTPSGGLYDVLMDRKSLHLIERQPMLENGKSSVDWLTSGRGVSASYYSQRRGGDQADALSKRAVGRVTETDAALSPFEALYTRRVDLRPRPDVVATLPEGTAIVEWVALEAKAREPARYVAFLVQRGRGIELVDLGNATEVDAAIEQWRHAIESGDPAHEAKQLLRQRLWEPLERRFAPRIARIWIAPDGNLTRVPWCALPGRKPNTVLLEEYTLSIVPYGAFPADRKAARRRTPAPPAPPQFLLVGDVDYDRRIGTKWEQRTGRDEPLFHWSPLPHSKTELDQISELIGSRHVWRLDRQEATSERLLESLRQATWVHLATHAFFFGESLQAEVGFDGDEMRRMLSHRHPLLLNGLVLAGANYGPSLDPLGVPLDDGGLLTANVIAHLPLPQLEMVVLSGCDTAAGVPSGIGTVGLQRAFHLAGADNVLASLWPVNDRAAAHLMRLFYYYRFVRQLPPAEALRQAQLHVFYHPDLVNDWSQLRAPDFRKAAQRLKRDPNAVRRAPERLWAGLVLSGVGE